MTWQLAQARNLDITPRQGCAEHPEILPSVITASGVQVGEGTAWELVTAFLKACAQRAADTGETVNVGSLVTFGLAIKGWYSNKDSKAAKGRCA